MVMVSQLPFQLSGRYAEQNKWEILNGPGDSRVTGSQVVKDEGLVDAWGDKVVLITGVSAGIGVETVRVLASTGATVFGTARNLEKAKEALGSIINSDRVHLLFMDQTDLSSVRACAEEFSKQSGKLNILINNAGVMNTPESRTKEAPYHNFNSRVVNVTSSAHRNSPVRFDNINFDGIYNGWRAYGSSKTANIYMTTQIERLYGSRGLHGYSVHPGSFESPNLQIYSQKERNAALEDTKFQKYVTNIEQACATSVYAAVSEELEGKGGLYLEGASIVKHPRPDGNDLEYGYKSWAFDREKEEALWKLSKTMVGVE